MEATDYTYTELKDTRSGFGAAMDYLGQSDERVVALCADLTGSLKLNDFAKNHPDRFFQAGIAEANMMGVAAGLTIGGKIPFATTFANFATGRVYDQIRQSIAYSGKNVKIAASHSGVTLGEDGATHQILRPKVPVFMPKDGFEIGKAIKLVEGSDVTIIATGHLVWESIEAAKTLKEQGISAEVLNIHTIKPLDADDILRSASKTKAVVTAEEHQMLGGLGGSVAQLLSTELPTKMAIVGVNDSFGESGKPEQLMKKYGIYRDDIVASALRLLK